MSVLVYTESDQGKFKKAALEVASYGKAVAEAMGTNLVALTFNANEASELGTYGVEKVLNINTENTFNAKIYADAIKQAAEKEAATVVILSASADSRYIAPLLAVGLKAGYASNVVAAPSSLSPFVVKRTAFTNKAFNRKKFFQETIDYIWLSPEWKVLSTDKLPDDIDSMSLPDPDNPSDHLLIGAELK